MDRFFMAIVIAGLAIPALAAEGRPELELKPKVGMIAAPHASAPFVLPAAGALQLGPRGEPHAERSRSACDGDQALCYDAGHIVFKPARKFMPEVSGLKAENISLKRDRVIFRYSF